MALKLLRSRPLCGPSASLTLSLSCLLGVSACSSVGSGPHQVPTQAAATPAASAASEPPEKTGVETVEYRPEDPAIQRAIEAARSALPQFFRLVGGPNQFVRDPALKIEIRDGAKREYIWVMPFKATPTGFEGTVNDIPKVVRRVHTGDVIPFSRGDIVDFSYTDSQARQLKGHYTTCALLRQDTQDARDALKRAYGLDCDRP